MNDFLIYTKKKERGNKKKRAKKIIITLKTSDKWEGGRERERKCLCVCAKLLSVCMLGCRIYNIRIFLVKNI